MLYWISVYLMIAIVVAVLGFGTYRRPRHGHPEVPILDPLAESSDPGLR